MPVYQMSVAGRRCAPASSTDAPSGATGPAATLVVPERPRFRYKPGWIEHVPGDLRRPARWVLWKFVSRVKADGTTKWAKMPFQAGDGDRPASATDPSTWSSFEDALRVFEAIPGRFDGLGYVLGRVPDTRDWFSGIDLDDCIDPDGGIAAWARSRLDAFASYAEISPSGRGVKIFVEGGWIDGESYEVLDGLGDDGTGQIEIARSGRFFTVTGDRVDASGTVLADGTLRLQCLHEWIAKERTKRHGLSGRLRRSAAEAGRPLPREDLVGLSPLEKFLAQLDAMAIRHARYGESYTACCPVHADTRPSMTFREAEDGRLLIHCHGCPAVYDEILKAVGLLPRDAFPGGDSIEVDVPIRPRRQFPVYGPKGVEIPRELIESMTTEAERCERAIQGRPEKLEELAGRLRVAEAALRRLRVGWKERNPRKAQDEWGDDGPAWTFPESDGKGRIIGIQRRFEDEAIGKRVISGSKRGLYVPTAWHEIPGPVYLPEGASDVAALLGTGFCAIGRPNASGGIEELAEMLGAADREIVIFGERDQKSDGRWPGRDCARAMRRALEQRLRRRVEVCFPPRGFKDIREFASASLTTNRSA